MDRFKYFIVVLVTLLIGQTFGFVISLNKNAVPSDSLEITLNLGTINTIVTLNKPDGSSAGNCLAPIGGVSGGCTTGLTQDFTNGVTNFSIASVSRATDEGTWTSSHGSDTGSITIKVLTIPASITEQIPAVTDFGLTTSTSETLTAVVECAYPSAQIDWEFVTESSASTGISPTRNTCTDMGLTGGSCSDAAAKTFHCDFTVTETSTASLSAGKYKLKANLYMDGEVTSTGISVELSTIITIKAATTTTTPATTTTTTPAISSSCGSCTPTNVLAALGIVFDVVCIVFCWMVYFKFSESGGGKGKFECSVTWCFRATIIATVVSVIGFILCIAGLIICVTCDDSVSSSNSVTVGFALAVVGFVLATVTLVIVIILVILFCCGVITKKDDGQTIKHVSVKNNDPLTLTCPAGDLATTLTWTGPGGIPYVTGTTVEADLDGSVKRRISASHKKRGYALMFTEVWSSDMGIYTSTVDETVVKHEVIVQDNKAVRARPDGQDAKPRTERTPRSAGSPTSASNIKTKWRNNQVSDSNESDGSNDTPRRKLEDVPQGRKLPALELVDASQKANTLEPLEVNETKKLKKKKKRRSKEEKAQVDGEY